MFLKLKKLFRGSISGKIYYRIKAIPPIKLFFDFEYAAKMWNESFVKMETDLILNRIEEVLKLDFSVKYEVFFIWLLGFCPYFWLWTENLIHIIILTASLAVYFLLLLKSRQMEYAVFYMTVFTVLFSPFIPPSAILSVIYAELAVICFFIIRNLKNEQFDRLLKITGILWVFQCLPAGEIRASATVAFMPYAISILTNDRITGYFSKAALIGVGFYALSESGREALYGSAAGILTMVVLGEWRLLVPVLLISPWVIGVGVRVLENGIFSENIIKTGYFFWSRSFKGASFGLNNINFGEYGKIALLIFSLSAFVFLWYVLRMSRQAVLKIFEKRGENKKLLRAGLGSIIGFSIYTFLSQTSSLAGNVLIYLWSAALLKRICRDRRKREETGANERKKDF